MKAEIEEYLGELTGKEVRLAPYELHGPLYLKRFQLYVAKLYGREVVFAFVRNDSLSPSDYLNHAAKLSERTGCPVVFVFGSITGSRRNAFLRTSVGFVVPKNQMFIPPFIDVKEWMPRVRERKDMLGNAAQVAVLREIAKGDVEGVPFCDLAERFGYSSTMITNAAADLADHDLAEVVGGRPKSLKFKARGAELWRLAKSLLQSPVRKTLLNRRMPHGLPCAGETALSERSMLSAPPLPVFAATGAVLKDPAMFEQADSKDDARSKIEVWSYDPVVIGGNGVDGYSLYLSLKDVSDPRVQGELEDMMKGLG